MSAFKTKQPCPVLSCSWSVFTDSFAKTPNNYQNQLRNHLRDKHVVYLWSLVIRRRFMRRSLTKRRPV